MSKTKMDEILRTEIEMNKILQDSIYGDFALSIEKVKEEAVNKYHKWLMQEMMKKMNGDFYG